MLELLLREKAALYRELRWNTDYLNDSFMVRYNADLANDYGNSQTTAEREMLLTVVYHLLNDIDDLNIKIRAEKGCRMSRAMLRPRS